VTDLSPPAERKLMLTRSIICTGYAREDGLMDIEAHMVDTKTDDVTEAWHGAPKLAGQPLHEMKIRVTIDHQMLINDAEAVTIHFPFDGCVIPPTIFNRLKGLSFRKGWKNDVAELMGGTKGCTHLLELLGNVATVGYQTVASSDGFSAKFDNGEAQPFFVDNCHAWSESGPLVKQFYPKFYKPLELKIKQGS